MTPAMLTLLLLVSMRPVLVSVTPRVLGEVIVPPACSVPPVKISVFAALSSPSAELAFLAFNSVLGAGEQITVSATGYPGHEFATEWPTRRFLQGALVFPVGIDGWKMLIAGTDGRTTPRVDLDAQTQGVYRQNSYVLAYDAVKKRDFQLTFSGRFDR